MVAASDAPQGTGEGREGRALQDAVAFVGSSLGPFFCYDPVLQADAEEPLYAAVASMDVRAAAHEWPFAPEDEALRALELMRQGLGEASAEGKRASAYEDVAREYRRLFVGPQRKAAPPWGSVYTDRDCVMFGASWVAFRAWLRNAGVTVTPLAPGEPEDHFGLMLQLMGWLAQNRPELLGEYLQAHLLPWSGHFLQLVNRETRHPFFHGLAALTSMSLDGIGCSMGLQVTHPRFYR